MLCMVLSYFICTTDYIENTMELTNKAYSLRQTLMSFGCVIQIIINDHVIFLYDRPCVWSNVTSEEDCYSKIHRELNIDDFIPAIWDNHREKLAKYFFPKNLSLEQAFRLYAPIQEHWASIARTPELVKYIEEHK
jgi:hypothetical protein